MLAFSSLCVLATSTNITIQNSKPRIEAFQYFFNVLKAKDVKSYRLFCIWLGGEYKKYKNKNYIGGSIGEAQKWIHIASDFLMAAHELGLKNFVFEIILDKETYDAHPFEQLKTQFPDHFKATRIEEKLKSYEPLLYLSLLSHFDDGNPAIASDVLRLWEIGNTEYDINCYRDIDNLIFHFDKLDLTNWKEHFKHDMSVQEGHIYRPCSIIEKPPTTSFSASNDHLVGYKVSEDSLDKVKNKFMTHIRPFQRLFSYYKKRDRFLSELDPSKAYKRYDEEISHFIDDLIKSENHYDFVRAVIDSTGPGFWIHNTDGNIICPMTCTKDPLISVNSWKPVNIYLGEGKMTELRQHIGEIPEKNVKIKNILKLHFMGYDHHFFKNFSHGLAAFLEQEMKKLWDSFSDEEKKILPTKLGSGIGYVFHLFAKKNAS